MKTYKNRYISDMERELKRERVTKSVMSWGIVIVYGLFMGVLMFICI